MQETDVLQRIRERTAELVAQNLRSASVVLGHMRGLIVEAHGIGHSHKAIHASLEAAGLRASWNTYKSCLVRMRKATRASPSSLATTAPAYTSGSALSARSASSSMQPDGAVADSTTARLAPVAFTHLNPTHHTSTATHVMDALRQAREIANSKDYGQIARDLYRQEQRDRRRKDRP
jgi:hypothetical protein